MMEGCNEEVKFVCKLCNKRYPCGKSLGGHMRSHVVESDEKFEANLRNFGVGGGGVDGQTNMVREFINGQQVSYGLRENPKKTWRAVGSTLPLSQERVCKQCGKVFQSMKALCGHMACHSDRDKGLKDDYSWSSENQKEAAVMDSYSDTEEPPEEMRLRTRSSKSKRYQKAIVKSPFGLANNGSSSVSEVDGQEQEEVAMCLMMLSRDSGNKGGANSVVESSDNNSIVLETKSSSIDMRIGRKGEGVNYAYNQEETPNLKKSEDRKLKGIACDAEIEQAENSDSGYFLDENAKAESDLSVDGFHRNGAFGEYKKPFWNVEGRGEEYGSGYRKSSNRIKNSRTELGKLTKYTDYDDDFAGIESRKRKYSSENPELWNESGTPQDEMCNSSQKRSKYECFNCKKSFKSYQALGGHRPCHKRSNAYYESRYESGENSLDDSTEFRTNGKLMESASNRKSNAKSTTQYADKKAKPKKNKGHVCPYCDRVFKNGQALGGHKRSHFIGGREGTITQTPVMRPETPDLLDLNLPAPEEEDEGRGQFFPW